MASRARLSWPRVRSAAYLLLAVVLVALSVIPFLRFVTPVAPVIAQTRSVLASFRSINAYHLFASMTLIRREAIIEGIDDTEPGAQWLSYEFRHKAGDLNRAPAFVAPHQPRVDFQLWFLLLGRRPWPPYFTNLLAKLLAKPDEVRDLFDRMPFHLRPPSRLRVAVYRYTFSDTEERAQDGRWWNRELVGYSRELDRSFMERSGFLHPAQP